MTKKSDAFVKKLLLKIIVTNNNYNYKIVDVFVHKM